MVFLSLSLKPACVCPKKILLVYAGNTCHSPIAKIILEQRLKSEGLAKQFKLDSAAYGEPSGISAHPNAQ